jgi:hypothetical protein
MVKAEENEPSALLSALKAGDFYSSQGPMIYSAEIVGGAVHVECSAVVNIAAVGRGSRSLHLHGRQMTRGEISLERFAGDWFRLALMDAAGRWAWSNPVRLPK